MVSLDLLENVMCVLYALGLAFLTLALLVSKRKGKKRLRVYSLGLVGLINLYGGLILLMIITTVIVPSDLIT